MYKHQKEDVKYIIYLVYYRWGDIHLDHGDDVKFLRDKIINDPTIIGVAGFS
jgi:hypothetical protein